MRTKTLILSALLGLAASPLLAQSNVYSVNAVGYVQVQFPANQFVAVANPLNTTNNTIGGLFKTLPDFTAFYKFNGASYDIATYAFGGWDNPQYTLNPGEGGFIKASANYTNTFVGEVLQGSLTNNFNSGFSMRSSMVPQTGTADALGLTAAMQDFDAIYQYNSASSSYDIYTYAFGSWSGPNNGTVPPTIPVASSFFLQSSGPRTWVRNFSVNN